MKAVLLVLSTLILSAGLFSLSHAQHPDDIYWEPGPECPGVYGNVRALATFNGQLVAGGFFKVAGGTMTENIAAWNGSEWLPLGSGLGGGLRVVYDLVVYDGKLVACGRYDTSGGTPPLPGIAAWDGSEWAPVGGLSCFGSALEVYEGRLIVAGSNFSYGTGLSDRVLAWDGSSWAQLGSGMSYDINDLQVFSERLIAGGYFTEAGGVPADRIAVWDGDSWSPPAPGPGCDGGVRALGVWDDHLIVGGDFTQACGVSANRIAAWNGDADWVPLGPGFDDDVSALAVSDGQLVAGGYFDNAGGTPASRIARWDGVSWSSLSDFTGGPVWSLIEYDNSPVAGGSFQSIDGTAASNIARRDGAEWTALGSDWTADFGSFQYFDGKQIVGGSFVEVDGVAANNIVAWDGSMWSALGSGVNGTVVDMVEHDGRLIACGYFTQAGGVAAAGIAAWNGSVWEPVGWSLGTPVTSLASYNGQLYAAYYMNVYRLGSSSWPEIGSFLELWDDPPARVYDLHVHDNQLIVSGYFSRVYWSSSSNNGESVQSAAAGPASMITVVDIASWNGTSWAPVGTGVGGNIYAATEMVEFCNDLYVILDHRGTDSGRLERWDGSSWSTVWAPGEYVRFYDLAVCHDQLIISGSEFADGGVPGNIAAWNGSSWNPLGSGLNGPVDALGVYDNDLWVAGYFSVAGGMLSTRFARWTKPWPTSVTTPAGPSATSLGQNHPNPFNPTTTIRYTVADWSRVTLEIYTPAGRLLRTLVDQYLTPGEKVIQWDGRNDAGRPVATGVYFYRLRAGKTTLTRKMVLLK